MLPFKIFSTMLLVPWIFIRPSCLDWPSFSLQSLMSMGKSGIQAVETKNDAQNFLQMATRSASRKPITFKSPIRLSVHELHLKSRHPSCHATPRQVNPLRFLLTPMMPFMCCPSWVNRGFWYKEGGGGGHHGREHLPVLQRHNKPLANASVWQNVFKPDFVHGLEVS